MVNGDIITLGDVDNRRRLLALSAGLPVTPELLTRLTPHVQHQLIDERLRLQEMQHRKVVVTDQDIAATINQIEARNNMPPGGMRRRLAGEGVDIRTMIDQVRVQLGWTKVLRDMLGDQAKVTDSDIADQERLIKAQMGQIEYHLAELFLPVTEPSQLPAAQRLADTIIGQLRSGSPFPVIAAEFSQNQNALQGGDMGWVQSVQIDPTVLAVIKAMPVGAISNPIRVPGGLVIMNLIAKRTLGDEPATMVRIRQLFLPFPTKLDPANPTEEQRTILEQLRVLSNTVTSCPALEKAAAKFPTGKSADPGEIRLDSVSMPALRQVMETLPIDKASQPLIAEDGAAVLMVCARETRNMGIPSRQEISDSILDNRVELASRQLLRDLQRRAIIDQKS